jgi:hypothetical protein
LEAAEISVSSFLAQHQAAGAAKQFVRKLLLLLTVSCAKCSAFIRQMKWFHSERMWNRLGYERGEQTVCSTVGGRSVSRGCGAIDQSLIAEF